ncbi:MAG: chorismate mutase [Micavibrio aeruginosavorus]|uniref:chorismate mutase n=1 Tax=Micavibrio aeruginosavorus TaxID=349221 RepID=A0A2W5FQJ2_9BACT|nr:MAG: chorismate mutase [Micavibrio aeruginosavorus]
MEVLKPYRTKIDALDDKIVDLLKQRFDIIQEVGALKARENIPAILEDRVREVIDRAGERAGSHENEIREIYTLMVTIACDLEEKIKGSYAEIV